MQELSVKTVLIGAFLAIVGALISGYFYSMGAEFWDITKGVQIVNPLFWVITVPLGLIGVGLCVYALYLMGKSKTIPLNGAKPPVIEISSGISIYRNPSDLEAVPPLFLGANSRAIILAIDGGLFTKRFYAQILDMCMKGKVLQFLFLDENSKLLDRIGDCWSLAGDPHKVLAMSLERLCRLKKELPTALRSNLQVRFYDLLPIHSMTIIDPESEDGMMQVTAHRYDTHDWSFLRISKREQPELFEKYWQSYRFAEAKSKEYQCDGK